MLCTVCESMLRNPSRGSETNAHHETITSLKSAAALGCLICIAVLDELQRISDLDSDHHGYEEPFLKYHYFHPFGYNISGMNRRILCDFSLIPPSQDPLRLPEFHSGTSESHTSSISINYRIPPDTGDPAVAELALSWLRKCLKNHERCGRGQDPDFSPPRLLDVSGNEPRLILTNLETPDGPYATLSHCWGPNPTFLRLTSSLIKEMQIQILTERLPENFRNAVQICRRLQVKYLWIDSLCIIQSGEGSHQDWLFHLSAMQLIYANCLVNIASTRAPNANGSCYTRRNPEQVEACIVPYNTYIMGAESIEPRLLVYYQLLTKGRQLTPLGSRGWVLQERVLSPRVLYFGPKQVFWECSQSQNECEAYPAGLEHQFDPCGPFELPAKDLPSSESDYNLWQYLIKTYTACSLTRPETDKLGAFSGIAERMASTFQEDYIAGYFRSELPEALLWSIPRQSVPPAPPGHANGYRAPSWSWASTDVQIQPYVEYTSMYNMHNPEPTIFLDILDFRIDLLDPQNKFGPLQHAELTLGARVAQLAWDSTVPLLDTEFTIPGLGCSCRSINFFFDNETAFYSDQGRVLILSVVGYEGWCIDGLVIKLVKSGSETYTRLGKARVYGEDITARFAAIEKKRVVLV